MSEWQPIATAPKDGTHVLVWNGYRRALGWYSRYSDMSSGWHHQSLILEPPNEPFDGMKDMQPDTHWMPLPAPPVTP